MLDNKDIKSNDYIKDAKISASSTQKTENLDMTNSKTLLKDYALVIPTTSYIDKVDILVKANNPTQLEYEIYETDKFENYSPKNLLKRQLFQLIKTKILIG